MYLSAAPKSQTAPHLAQEYVKLYTASSTSSSTSSLAQIQQNRNASGASSTSQTTKVPTNSEPGNLPSSTSTADTITPLLYENLTINNKDCNVPYENINLEYIARLMNEGYSKENVITALGISRNDIEMACEILHEFVSKSGA